MNKHAQEKTGLIPSANRELLLRSSALVRRGLSMDLLKPSEDATIKQLREAAERGDVDAQCDLGMAYASGEAVPQDHALAVQWFRKAAEQGDAFAQLSLGVAYEDGKGVSQDWTQAVHWYRQAAEQGDDAAQYCLGVAYDFGRGVPQDWNRAAQLYLQAVEQGNSFAQYNLAVSYTKGKGVTQDDEQAAHWYRKAAEQGNEFAQNDLGVMYARGSGVARDYAQGVQWLRKAAEQGHARAQNNLSEEYASGRGVPQDYIEAYKWASLSVLHAEQSGPPDALADQERFADGRDALANKMRPEELSEARKRATEWTEAFSGAKTLLPHRSSTPPHSSHPVASRPRVLIVDDEASIRDLLAKTLALAEYDVDVAPDGQAALEQIRLYPYVLLITDLKMPDMDGLTVIREAKRYRADLPVIIITGFSTERSAVEAVKLGVAGYLTKPFRVPQVLAAVAKALE